MKIRIAATLIVAALSQAAVAADSDAGTEYWSNIDASFADMLAREPHYGPTAIAVTRGVKDPVELALHWREQGAAQGAAPEAEPGYWHNVNASFANMLGHTPYAGPTAVTVELGMRDPVERMVFEMLKDVRQPISLARR